MDICSPPTVDMSTLPGAVSYRVSRQNRHFGVIGGGEEVSIILIQVDFKTWPRQK